MRPHTALITLGIAIIAFVGGVELGARTAPMSDRAVARTLAPPAVSRVELIPDGPVRRGPVVDKVAVVEPVDPETVEAAIPVPVEIAPAPLAEAAPLAPEAEVVQPVATLELPEGQPAADAITTVARTALKAAGIEPPVAPVAPTPPPRISLVEVQPAPDAVTALTPRILEPQPILLEAPRVPEPVVPPVLAVAPQVAGPGDAAMVNVPGFAGGGAMAGPDALYAAAYAAYEDGQYDTAVSLWQQFLVDYADSALADNAAYWIAECAYGRREFAEAAEQFAMVAALYPDSNKVPDALLKEAYALAELGRPQEMRVLLQRIVTEHGNSRAATLARSRLAQLQ